MIAFGHARADDHKFIFGQARYCEIPSNPPAHTDQRRQARAAHRLGHLIGEDGVEPRLRLPATDAIFGEIRNIYDPSRIAQHAAFAAHGLEPILPGEAICVLGAGVIGKPLHMLPAVVQPKHAAKGRLQSMGRAGADRPASIALFIGKMDRKTLGILVAHPRLGKGLIGPVAKTRDIPSEHIILAFALHHPLRRHQTHTARLAKTRDDPITAEIVCQIGMRAKQYIAVG